MWSAVCCQISGLCDVYTLLIFDAINAVNVKIIHCVLPATVWLSLSRKCPAFTSTPSEFLKSSDALQLGSKGRYGSRVGGR